MPGALGFVDDSGAWNSKELNRNDPVGAEDSSASKGPLRNFAKTHTCLFGLLKAWVVVGIYLVSGIVIYIYALEEPWTVIDTMYFSVATMSTVGYGDISPNGAWSRAFTCLYIIVGVTYVFSVIAQAATVGMLVIETQLEKLVRCCQRLAGINPDAVAVDLDGDGDVDYVPPPAAWIYYLKGIGFWVFVLFILQAGSVAVLTACQPGLLWNEAAYHCFVTMTTVGYGDVALTTQEAKLAATVHILISVTLLATFISKFQALYAGRLKELKRAELLSKQLDVGLITSLDTDGDGVNKVEFVVGMLTKLELIAWADVGPFMAQFDAMDTDGGGILTADDLAAMVAQKQAKADAKAINGNGRLSAAGHEIAMTPRSSSSSPTTGAANAGAVLVGPKEPLEQQGSLTRMEPPLVGRKDDKKDGHKHRSKTHSGKPDGSPLLERCVSLTQQSLDRIRVLEADGQLRREHAKKIELKLEEQARAQLRLEESLHKIIDLLTDKGHDASGAKHRTSHRSSRANSQDGNMASASKGQSPAPGLAQLASDSSGTLDSSHETTHPGGMLPSGSVGSSPHTRSATRDDSRGRTVRKRVPIASDGQEPGSSGSAQRKSMSL